MMKRTNSAPLKTLVLATALAFSFNAGSALAEHEEETYDNSSWQSPLAVEFYALDTTGNGLLLPYEASKGKAFTKKTFAQADTDRDGYIDQNEYIAFKTNTVKPETIPATSKSETSDSSISGSAKAMTTAEGDAMADEDMSGTQMAAEKRTVGKVIDDSIITAKAKAEILKAPQLKSLQISVETRNGEVLLSGFVDNATARLQAEEIVAKIEGVKTVINNLEVKA